MVFDVSTSEKLFSFHFQALLDEENMCNVVSTSEKLFSFHIQALLDEENMCNVVENKIYILHQKI